VRSVARFVHSKIVIHAGETVEWTNSDAETPHNITFGVEPQDLSGAHFTIGEREPDGRT
jgi:plastocyanin